MQLLSEDGYIDEKPVQMVAAMKKAAAVAQIA